MARAVGRRLGLVAAAIAAIILSGPDFGPGQIRDDALLALLPADQAVPGWSRDGGPREFTGEDLFTYIDGGAEIYKEYGFRRVAVQDYKSPEGTSVSLEIFEMAWPPAAFGMFTFKRSGKGKVLSLGGGGELEDYYLNFWKDRYLVTLTGFDSSPATLAGLQAIAASVDGRIEGEREAPRQIVLLPQEGLRRESIKYLKGILGLINIYPFRTLRRLDFLTAVKGDYLDGTTLIVLDYPRMPENCKASLLELWKAFDEGEGFKRVAEKVYQDERGRFLTAAGLPLWIVIGLGPDAESARNRVAGASAYLIRTFSR